MLRTLFTAAMALAIACSATEEPVAPAPVQGSATAPTVAALKDQVSQLNARLRRVRPDAHDEASRLLTQRAEALSSLITLDARTAVTLALPDALAQRLATAHPRAAAQVERRGQLEGELEVIVVDDPHRTELRTDTFVTVKGERLQVRFTRAAPKDLRSGQLLRVRGVRLGSQVAAESAELLPSRSASATLNGACSTTGEQRSIVILATFPGQPQTLTKDEVREVFFSNTQRSLTGYWQEVSQGRTSTSGDVTGWYTLDRAYTCEESYNLQRAAIAAADADVDFRDYDRIFIVHPASPAGCYYGGLGTLGCTSVSTQEGTVTASVSWLRAEYMAPNDLGVELVTHEGGHNLTLHHASSRDFGTEPLGPMNTRGTLVEYGDWLSAMGSWNLGHYAAPHKSRIGWMDPGTVLNLDRQDGTFTLAPIDGPRGAGPTALRIRRGNYGDGYLWVEYRQPLGNYDTTLPSQVFGGALIHYEDPYTGSYSHLLDFTQSTDSFYDPALVAGQTWSDPYSNLSLTVQAATPAGLTVGVSYAPVPCVSAPPTVELYPYQSYVEPGRIAEFDAAITNNDSIGCPVTSFPLKSLLPSGWYTEELPEYVVLEPGHQTYVYFTKTPPSDAPFGPVDVELTATRNGQSVSATAPLEVVPPCVRSAPLVTVTPLTQTVRPSDTTSYTVTVTNQDTLACGWGYFEVSSSLPSGWQTDFDSWGFDLEPAGGSMSVTMTKVVPAGASGPYDTDVQVLREGSVVEATATVSTVVDPCVRGSPSIAVSPSRPSVHPGAPMSVTVTVTNTDASACGGATFTFASDFPQGWTNTFSPSALTLAPGQTGSVSFVKDVPPTASAGVYGVPLFVYRDGQFAHGVDVPLEVVCTPAPPSVSFSPNPGAVQAGKPFTFTLTVKSNDEVSCLPSTFTLAASVPAGWSSALTQTTVSQLAAGGSATVSFTVTPPEATASGRYALSVSASRPSWPGGSGSGNLDVSEPPLTATLSGPAASYKRNSVVPLNVSAKKGTLAAAQAAVRFNVLRPDGGTTVINATTGASGSASGSYTASQRGTVRVTATVTSGAQTVSSNTVSFTVN